MLTWKLATPLLLAVALVGCNKADNTAASTTDAANMTAKQHMEAREDIMKSWGKASKAMGAMVKDPTTFNATTFKAEAEKMTQDPWGHFGPETKGGDSLDAIWTDTADFQQKIDNFKVAATALNTAAATATNVDGIKTQYADLGASCKSCHDKYKKD